MRGKEVISVERSSMPNSFSNLSTVHGKPLDSGPPVSPAITPSLCAIAQVTIMLLPDDRPGMFFVRAYLNGRISSTYGAMSWKEASELFASLAHHDPLPTPKPSAM